MSTAANIEGRTPYGIFSVCLVERDPYGTVLHFYGRPVYAINARRATAAAREITRAEFTIPRDHSLRAESVNRSTAGGIALDGEGAVS